MLGPGGATEPVMDDESMGHVGWTQGNAYPSIPEATFIAGAAVQQALHASQTAAQAASQAEVMQAQMFEAQGVAQALHIGMQEREQQYAVAATALRAAAEQQVQQSRLEAAEAIRQAESRIPGIAEEIRREVQAHAEAWTSSTIQGQVQNMEARATEVIEQQRQAILVQAIQEVERRDSRIRELEEQNSRLLDTIKAQPQKAQMAAMSRLAQDTPLRDASGLTTPRSAVPAAMGAEEGQGMSLCPPDSWASYPPGLEPGGLSQPERLGPHQELSVLLEQVRTLRDHLAARANAATPAPIPPPPVAPPLAVAQGAAGGAPPTPPPGGGRPVSQLTGWKSAPSTWPVQATGNPGGGGGGSDSSDSGGDSDSSSSDEEPSPSSGGQPPAPPECRICGGFHDEVNCPHLSGNADAASTSSKTPAEEEESLVRVKDLKDMTLPGPPTDSGQARGYVNQVLMAIGRLQKTSGNDLYQWAQECLTMEEDGLQACARFPRTDREIAAKLLKTCKKGRWGLLFQQMVEQQRILTGGMPCGRVMLRKIFHHFKLERDRLGC